MTKMINFAFMAFVSGALALQAQNAPTTKTPEANADSLGFKNAKFSLSAWSGIGVGIVKSTHTREFESYGANAGIGQKATIGSPAFGATGWFGNGANAVGFEASYATLYKNTSNTAGVNYKYSLAQIGLQLLYRYEIFDGLYAAAGAGIAIPVITAENTAYVQASVKAKVAPLFSARVGYDYPLTPQLVAGAYLQFSYAFISVDDKFTTTAQSYSAGPFMASPIVQLTYKF